MPLHSNGFPTADRPESSSFSFKLSSTCPWQMRHRFSFLQSRSTSSCVPCIRLTSHLQKRSGLHHRNTLDTSGPSSLLLPIRKISQPRNAGSMTIIVCFFRAYTRILINLRIRSSDVKLSLICRPISFPILSKRARRETPKIGSTNSRASIPRTKSALAVFYGLNPVSIQSIEDLPAPPVDDVLCVLLSVDALGDTDSSIASLL